MENIHYLLEKKLYYVYFEYIENIKINLIQKTG